ncbi:non-specific lipid transfer protein GPI-anchored 25 [Medicago truncatula]|uniref:Lipid transfer protein n=1 Tax=Medicago truncatula TaxID=3880 RepID=G7IQH2_MEDTR|nr:non-specific lipid transfer protein GPI-anchored 25 [Medicago truncatula]AES65856.1 Lipid transfer protein [Medicago truncatula]
MENTFFFFLMLSLGISAVTVAVAPPPPSSREGCTDQLLLFSPCLSYVSSPPNNLTETASTKCCDAFWSTFVPNSLCFCYLLRDNHILGFPLNSTRLQSLSSLCVSPPPTTSSFNVLCAESRTLPPLGSADILGVPVTPSGTGSAVSSSAAGKMIPRGKGAGTTPSLNGSTSSTITGGGYYKHLLLTILFVTLPLLNLNTLYY